MNELKFATTDEALQYLAQLEDKKVVVAAPTTAPAPTKAPVKKPTETPKPAPGKQPRTIPMPQPKNKGKDVGRPGHKSFASRELCFASENEAIQYFAGMLNARVVIRG